MARPRPIDTRALADDLGRTIGAALAEGIAQGLAASLAQVQAELAPLGEELARAMLEQARTGSTEAPVLTAEGLRVCGEPGCGRRAIARGFCRRHYARMVYQERKAREGRETAPRRARTRTLELVPEPPKPVVPVAPIVRRRSAEPAAVDTALPAPAAAARPANVTPESVARFFGLAE